MKYIFFLFAFYSLTAFSQNDSAQITSLNFPYRKNYNMQFNSYTTYWGPTPNGYGIKVEGEGEFRYEIKKEEFNGTDTVVTFYATKIFQGDTVTIESPLYINKDGMFFYYPDDQLEKVIDNRKIDKEGNYIFQTIKTPLYKGMTWQSYDYFLELNTFTCTTLDTLIETPAGTYHAFGIETATSKSNLKKELKDYTSENRTVSYYAQGVGKIAETYYVYLFNKKTGEYYNEMKVEIYLNEVWWTDE